MFPDTGIDDLVADVQRSRSLTDAERTRFIEWLERDIRTAKMVIDQMGHLPLMKTVVKRLKQDLVASSNLLVRFRNIESQADGDK